MALPFSLRCCSSGCTSINFLPSRASLLTVQTTLPITRPRSIYLCESPRKSAPLAPTRERGWGRGGNHDICKQPSPLGQGGTSGGFTDARPGAKSASSAPPCRSSTHFDTINNAHNRGIHRAIFATARHPCGTTGNNQNLFLEPCAHRIHRDEITALILSRRAHRLHPQQFFALEAGRCTGGDSGAHTACQNYRLHSSLPLLAGLPDGQHVF